MTARLIRLPEVESRCGLRKSAIYSHIRDGRFPAPVRISPKLSAWVEADIDAWIAAQIAQSRGKVA